MIKTYENIDFVLITLCIKFDLSNYHKNLRFTTFSKVCTINSKQCRYSIEIYQIILKNCKLIFATKNSLKKDWLRRIYK